MRVEPTGFERLRGLAMAMFATLVVGGAATAEEFLVNPDADAFVSAANHDKNYGGAGGLAVSAPGLPKGEFQSVLRFDAAAIKEHFDDVFGAGNWTPDHVELRLNAASPNNKIFNASAAGRLAASWMEDDSWEEGTGSPSNPTTDGIAFDTLGDFLGPNDENLGTANFDGSTSGLFTFAFDLPAGFAADLAGGDLVSVRLLAGDDVVSGVFRSANNGDENVWPVLAVSAVPEPATLALLAGAVMIFPRRR